MKILIKIPTRDRTDKFFKLLDVCVQKLSGENEYQFLVSCDEDDLSMNNDDVKYKMESYENLRYYFSKRDSKIAACNRDMDKASNWDVVVLMSDDMMPLVDKWDLHISNGMKKYFPDTDGVLWLFDGFREDLMTISILGYKYYKRFDYIYYPGYRSFYCDNEFTIVAQKLNKVAKVDWPLTIIEHQHYSLSKEFRKLPLKVKKTKPLTYADNLYADNRKPLEADAAMFEKRSREKYGL